jgi:hypothetical protein
MSLRGSLWRLLLDVDVRKTKGFYVLLVDRTLGQELAAAEQVSADQLRERVQQVTGAAGDGEPVDARWAEGAGVWLVQIQKDVGRTPYVSSCTATRCGNKGPHAGFFRRRTICLACSPAAQLCSLRCAVCWQPTRCTTQLWATAKG